MKTRRHLWLSVLPALVLLGCVVSEPRELKRVVDELFVDYTGDRPGAAVRVIRNGEPVLTRTYGIADAQTGEAVNARTNFRLASVTKHMTALAVLMLVEEGELSLDQTLTELFDGFPRYGASITVEHLLQHRSGLLDYEPLVPTTAREQVRDADVLAMMMAQSETYFAPGSEYRYSNSGYAVLAMLVESLSGMSFEDALTTRLFQPNGMAATVAYVQGVNSVSERAFGYTVTDEGSVMPTDQSLYSAVLGDGGVYSSLEDLTRWARADFGAGLVSAETMRQVLAPALEDYGFGWRIDALDGKRRVHHSGSTSGFRNHVVRFPDDGVTVIVLTNRAGPDVRPLADQVAALYLKLYPK